MEVLIVDFKIFYFSRNLRFLRAVVVDGSELKFSLEQKMKQISFIWFIGYISGHGAMKWTNNLKRRHIEKWVCKFGCPKKSLSLVFFAGLKLRKRMILTVPSG